MPDLRRLDDVPDHYHIHLLNGQTITAMDITDALRADFNLGCALKYLIRCGRKNGAPASSDLRKSSICSAGAAKLAAARELEAKASRALKDGAFPSFPLGSS